MKKLFSLLLTAAMVCSLAVTAGAADVVPISASANGTAAPVAAPAPDLTGSTVILHTNDVHGAIAGYAKVAALKQYYQDCGAYVLLLDAGDYIQGDPSVSASQGATAIELMNLAGYDAAALGNHEFDYGYDNLVKLSKAAKFPILSANTLYNGKTAFGDNKIFTTPGGKKIGVFGLETPETATKAHPGKIKGVTFPAGEAMFKIAQNQVDALKSAGCDIIVCLGHLGIDSESVGNRSIDLLNAVKGIDLFIDGHSHSTRDEVKAATGGTAEVNGTPLTSTGTKLESIGVVIIDANGQMTESTTPTETLTGIDKTVADRAAAIQKQIDDDYGAVFAKTLYELNGAKAPNGNRDGETNLGDLITDALVWGAKQNGETVDAAITNGGGIRATIKAGDITKKDVNTVLPFGNTLSIVKVTGTELLEALEASTYCTPDALGGFPQVSGIQFTIDTGKSYDAGALYPDSTYHAPKSINRVTIQSVGGKAFDEKAVYTIATNDFMAAGGDTYYAFKAASANYNIGVPMDEVLMDYIKTELKGVVGGTYAKPQGRITLTKTEAPAEEPAKPAEPAQPSTPAQPAKPADGDGGETSYTVVSGDCLWNIAYRHYGSGAKFTMIAEANGLKDPYLINIGQVLVIPAA